MKLKITFIGIISALILFVSCSRDTASVVENRLTSGNWKVTYYYDSNHDQTSVYSSMEFNFDNNGTVSVSSGSDSYSGTWSTGNDDSKDKLYLTFTSPTSLVEISDDWVIDSESTSKIELSDDSENDLLTFEKQ